MEERLDVHWLLHWKTRIVVGVTLWPLAQAMRNRLTVGGEPGGSESAAAPATPA
jgi:hypothetical protein